VNFLLYEMIQFADFLLYEMIQLVDFLSYEMTPDIDFMIDDGIYMNLYGDDSK
jgi:hypothetical protein